MVSGKYNQILNIVMVSGKYNQIWNITSMGSGDQLGNSGSGKSYHASSWNHNNSGKPYHFSDRLLQ